MDGGAWWAPVGGIIKSRTRLELKLKALPSPGLLAPGYSRSFF